MHAETNDLRENMTGVLRSVQVGTPHAYGKSGAANSMERAWTSSFFRAPVTGPRWLYTTHLEGNEQADRKNHGYPSQAVLVYAAGHYPRWQAELGRTDIAAGGFGENFTVNGLTEETVCLGDTYVVGDARIEVSGPRYPCGKIERRWQIPGLTARVAATGRTGWYCWARHEGSVEAGMPLVLRDRPCPEWTMARMNAVIHRREQNPDVVRALLACPYVNDGLRPFIARCVRGEI